MISVEENWERKQTQVLGNPLQRGDQSEAVLLIF